MNEAAEEQQPSGTGAPIVHRFTDAATLASALAQRIAAELSAAIAAREQAILVLSGGRTPIRFFCQLSQQKLPWPKLIVTLADERWAPINSADSNERLIREHLLAGEAGNARLFGLKNPAATARAGQPECEAMLRNLPQPFDVVVLGMGDDGHFASLFPETRELDAALDLTSDIRCIAVTQCSAPHGRISQTLAALLDTRLLILHIEGERKSRKYQQALTPGGVDELPARALLAQRQTPVEVYWAP